MIVSYFVGSVFVVGFLSSVGHVESCMNLGGPPSKAKYGLVIDSGLVP